MERLKSRKFWFAVITALGIIFSEGLGFSQEIINALTAVAVTAIGGIGAEDIAKAMNKDTLEDLL